jgi:phage terminase large subunit GpA-like protein
MGYSPARDILRTTARGALKPAEKLTVSQWADLRRVVPEGTSERHGRWDTGNAPYLRELMDSASDPSVERITFRKASQVGGTEFLINFCGWAADCDPGPMLVVYPGAELAKSVAQERFRPAIMATPTLHERLKDLGRERKADAIRFDRMRIQFVGSNSEGNLASRPIRYVLLDDTDYEEFSPKAIDLASQRTKSFTLRKIIITSVPSFEDVGVDHHYRQGDMRRYEVPCPHCGGYQELVFGQVKWHGGREASPAAVYESAWYECVHCGGRIENHHKLGMLRGGVWVPEGQQVRRQERKEEREKRKGEGGEEKAGRHIARKGDATQEDDGPELVGVPRVSGSHRSYRISALYALGLPWGYVPKRFLAAGRMTKEIVNGDLGEPWAAEGDRVETAAVRQLARPIDEGGYKAIKAGGKLPAPVLAMVGAVDLQLNRAYVTVHGFTAGGRESYLLWWDCRPCSQDDPQSITRLVRELTAMRFAAPLLGVGGGVDASRTVPLEVAAWGFDSGDRTLEVYDGVMGAPVWYATKGAGATMRKPFELSQLKIDTDLARSSKQAKYQRLLGKHVKFLLIGTHVYKSMLMNRFRAGSGAGGAERGEDEQLRVGLESGGGAAVTAGGERFLQRLPVDVSEELLRQITSEQLSTKVSSGQVKMLWSLRPGYRDNHYLDTFVIAHALADALGVAGLTDERARGQRAAMAAGNGQNGKSSNGQMKAGEKKAGNWMAEE